MVKSNFQFFGSRGAKLGPKCKYPFLISQDHLECMGSGVDRTLVKSV